MDLSLQSVNAELSWKAKETRTPLIGIFELTGRCNLSCRMCYVRRAPNDKSAIASELSTERWLDLGRQAADEGLLYLLLTGGEPFIRPDFFEIYEGLRELGIQISINTNATMITPEIAQRLAANPPVVVNVTLYGASAETYERTCGDASGFERTLRGISLLRDAGIPVDMRTTIIRQNLDDFEQIYQISKERKLKLELVDFVLANRDKAESTPFEVRLSAEEQAECVLRLDRMLTIDGRKPKDKNQTVKDVYIGGFYCASGNFSFSVNYAGNLCACLLLDDPSVPLGADGSFAEQWRTLVKLCENTPTCKECIECDICEHCVECVANRKSETGVLDKAAPYLCKMAEYTAAHIND